MKPNWTLDVDGINVIGLVWSLLGNADGSQGQFRVIRVVNLCVKGLAEGLTALIGVATGASCG
ncbi:MAG: hypothetical protein AT713_05545 [Caldivirga sp. JCHS_4]|jgi:hypothetical protein|nr:MAG: hypothetical protein AT713_05545 [Caldivirga sp. JCHS_4]